MTGLYETDIRLNDDWQLMKGPGLDAAILLNAECFLQDLKIEAMTQEGELFYDTSYGWSLYAFLQKEYDEMVELEIKERIKAKLSRRDVINMKTVEISLNFSEGILFIKASFAFIGSDDVSILEIELNRLDVEVIES